MKHRGSTVNRARRAATIAAVVAMLGGVVRVAQASPPMDATGTFTQTDVLSEEVRSAGPNVIMELTIGGVATGSLSGIIVDSFTVVIRPNGRFSAHGTVTCVCTVDGQEGVLVLAYSDSGEFVEGTPTFEGRYAIKGGSGELSGLRGVLPMVGQVDLSTGLSTTDYSGQIHFHP